MKSKTCLPFLFYLLKSKRLNQIALKTIHPIITQTFLKIFDTKSRTLRATKITETLSTIDEAIQKTKGIGHKEFKLRILRLEGFRKSGRLSSLMK